MANLGPPRRRGGREGARQRPEELVQQHAVCPVLRPGRFRRRWIGLGLSTLGVPVGLLANKIWTGRRGRQARGGPRPYPGFFLVFEGGEGAGKSTQVQAVGAWFAARGLEVVSTREPGATDVGRRLRALLLDPDVTLGPRSEALLYAADRAEHVATVVRPALDRGAAVISDRYVDSSLAYQGAGRDLDIAEVARLSEWATGDLVPDLTVLLDLPPEIGLARAQQRSGHDRLEAEQIEFHQRVRAHFLRLADQEPRRYAVIDATATVADVTASVLEAVAAAVPSGLVQGNSPRQKVGQ